MNQLREAQILSQQRVADKTFWRLKHGLIPFTIGFRPEAVHGRRCRGCTCFIKDGLAQCPFCGSPSPTGPTTRAWAVDRHKFVEWDDKYDLEARPVIPADFDPDVGIVFAADHVLQEDEIDWGERYE